MSNKTTMPKNRSGSQKRASSIPEYDEPSLLEQGAPVFRTPEEYQKWLAGDVKRRDVVADFKRLGNGIGLLSHFNGELDSKFEALVRELVTGGFLDMEKYKKTANTQLQFKQVLDTVNFMMKEVPLRDRVTLVLQWNEEHSDHYIYGGYVTGLVYWLKKNPDNVDIVTRYTIATGTHLDVEQLFTPEELIAYSVELGKAEVIPALEPVDTPSTDAGLLPVITSEEKENA